MQNKSGELSITSSNLGGCALFYLLQHEACSLHGPFQTGIRVQGKLIRKIS